MVEEVVNPVLERTISLHENVMSPDDVETISLISNGFSDLAESNPELTYSIILDLLNGINEHELIRKHITGTSSGLIARNTVKQRSTVSASASSKHVAAELEAAMAEEDSGSEADSASRTDSSAQQRGPVAEMLYSRWLEVSADGLVS
jgi:serine/threonine-protein kinase 24/25/MST4